MDCFNHSCPFRVNETSDANRCECIACQNRSNSDFIITSNRTLTNDECAAGFHFFNTREEAKNDKY